MYNKFIIYCFLFSVAGLIACSSYNVSESSFELLAVDNTRDTPNVIDSIIEPYKDSMDAQMNTVIGFSEQKIERSKPNGDLNNWCTDALTAQFKKDLIEKNFFTLLNYGGMRSGIGEGDVTLSTIFRLMPFDNEVVLVEMPNEMLDTIALFLTSRSGEPISNAKLYTNKLSLNDFDEKQSTFWVITSDYLMNGGDNMWFFENKIQVVNTGVLLRQVFIDEVKNQNHLFVKKDKRIMF